MADGWTSIGDEGNLKSITRGTLRSAGREEGNRNSSGGDGTRGEGERGAGGVGTA